MITEHTLGRRRVLGLLTGAGAVALGACRSNSDTNTTTDGAGEATTTTRSGGSGSVGEIPSETVGPFPADGTNGPNLLTEPGVVRSDIRTSIGSGSATAQGVPLHIDLRIVDASTNNPLSGAAVYIWQCDRESRYSIYEEGVTEENYLRGVQVADGSGQLRFISIFPGAYAGRFPHMHFEVFESAAKATTGRNARKISQLALPESACRDVYKTAGYGDSQMNLAETNLSSDLVFRDGSDRQLATVTRAAGGAYTASLVVGV
ncbi:MAG: dioxygenase [Gemmatimonadaceae bacterium]|nr:dioxygenase [Gemmatimonadaceae bacterium]